MPNRSVDLLIDEHEFKRRRAELVLPEPPKRGWRRLYATTGAQLRLGGTEHVDGCFYPPTVLTDVAHGSTINSTEIFGPVAAVVRYTDVDEAVRMANDSEFGLAAYVFGPEVDAVSVAGRLEAGMVGVNRGVISDPAAPFGGVKQSGLGREGSSEGIREYLEMKYIALP